MQGARSEAKLTAVLGPTNTGKTHYAIERMLAHSDGMIGLPLRLLAREVYERVVKAKGAAAAALVTGEEKIWPDSARFFICTVEAMPLDRRTSFLAVDEIQLARDPDRGHVFTDRILRARGLGETLLLGSDTMRPMLRRLLPNADYQRRERLSTLSYAGPKKLTKLSKRTAIVAFSAEEVYAIAELIRRHKGGAAIVMGALSPRTRNAQVALYQSGEVDYLVATDAIGMGLNMDVDHVAFASRMKFDGRRARALRADELAQIAGRAGRFRDDGAFGETAECPPIPEDAVRQIEAHEFDPVEAIEWRSHELEFRTVQSLLRTLQTPPQIAGLVRVRGATDEETLKRLAADEDVTSLVQRTEDVRRLWDVCLMPDFRKATIDEHARLSGQFAKYLLSRKGRLPQDWIAREVQSLDRAEGDIDTLQGRLAHIRTWTYAANRPDWLDDCEHWRGRAREIEDKLSDALHTQLAQRFIDRRTSALVRGMKREDAMLAGVSAEGEVTVEGHYVGRLDGLVFRVDPRAEGREGKAVKTAALRALAPEVNARLLAIAADADEAFDLDERGRLSWRGERVGGIVPGSDVLRPRVGLLGGEAGDASARSAAEARLERRLRTAIEADLAPLVALAAAAQEKTLAPAARGLAFQLAEASGAMDRRAGAELVDALDQAASVALRALGVKIGRHTIYAPALLHPAPQRLMAILRHVTAAKPEGAALLPTKATHMALQPGATWAVLAAIGFRPAGPLALRIDRIERFAAAAARASEKGRVFPLTPQLSGQLGCPRGQVGGVLAALGYRRATLANAETGAPETWRQPVRTRPRTPASTSSPFAALARGASAAEAE